MKVLVVGFGAILLGVLPRAAEAQQPGPLTREDFTVAGLNEEADSAGIRGVLGRPDSVVVSENPFDVGGKLQAQFYQDLAVHFGYSGAPLGFTLTGPSVATHRGMRVGDNRERARQLYGDPAYGTDDVWVFTDPENLEGLHVVQIEFEGERVRMIYVGWLLD